MTLQSEVIERLFRNRPLAHQEMFTHRSRVQSAPFHTEIIKRFHSPKRMLCDIAFRDAAKSTLAEQGTVLQACFRELHHAVFVGVSLPRAQERLHAVRRHFEKNKNIKEVFGDLRGQPWGDDKIELNTGITIQAMGRGQAIRGTKDEEVRPDLLILDDIDDLDSIRNPDLREKYMQWFLSELLPAGDVNVKVRFFSNDLGLDCIANRLKEPKSGFDVRVWPIEFLNDAGDREASWPSKFPLEKIDEIKSRFESQNRVADFYREYMCRSEAPEDKAFKPDMIRIEPQPQTWHSVYAMFDPARTVNRNSAATGFACWSWIGPKMVVWDSWAKMLMPDEIIKAIFDCQDQFHPTLIGVERDGLEQWLMQPIRQEQVRRGEMLPIHSEKAPKGKFDFIRGLQPFFQAREIVFAKECDDLKKQLLAFPTGRIDAPNALAYALKMRPGAPVYDNFSGLNIAEELVPARRPPIWLAMNATHNMVTAVAMQMIDGAWRIFNDWVREGDPATLVPHMVREASIDVGEQCRLVAPPQQFEKWNNFGLVQAAQRLPREVRTGAKLDVGREEVRDLLSHQTRGMPALMVAERARWTLNGFAGGYARVLTKQGILADYAEEGPYRVLMEGLESLVGLGKIGSPEAPDAGKNWQYASDGRRFMSTQPPR